MKNLFLMFTLTISSQSFAIQNWECLAKSGLMGSELTKVAIHKEQNGYAVYVTASSGDVGPQWQLDNEKVAEWVDCKVSQQNNSLYCEYSQKGEWVSVRASEVQVNSIDQTSGVDEQTKFTEVILSGSLASLKNFKNSVLRFNASVCSKN